MNDIIWKKYPVLNDGFICLVDVMGDDEAIVQAARVSYGKDEDRKDLDEYGEQNGSDLKYSMRKQELDDKDRRLIRRLMCDQHTSPFEMVEFKFKVRVPMDCWRQWIRHRTANVNEYSTRYSEVIDSQQTTAPDQWRLQSSNNKQGSLGFLEKWPDKYQDVIEFPEGTDALDYNGPGDYLSQQEKTLQEIARAVYEERIAFGVAREQARKDLPLSTYTEAYWKCDLHNIFNFLRLRLDPHAQLEIRLYAEAMASIVKQVCPVAYEAFEDYVLNARRFSSMEMEIIRTIVNQDDSVMEDLHAEEYRDPKMTDNEWVAFKNKLNIS